MKKVQDHTRMKENDYKDSVVYGNMDEINLARAIEIDETTMDHGNKDEMYMNVSELKAEARSNKTVEKDKTSKNKTVSTSNTKSWVILAALIILIIMFLILSVITGILLKYYLEIIEEMSHLQNHDLAVDKEISHLKNHSDDQQRTVLEDVKSFKMDFENVKQNFLQDMKNFNKTLEYFLSNCPTEWKPIGHFRYCFSNDKLSWDSARDDCVRKRSTLLIFKSTEEMDALKFWLEKDRYWIGLRRDTTDPTKFRWLDGSMMTFENWAKGEPNNVMTELCGESFGNWNDRNCETKLKYVCQK